MEKKYEPLFTPWKIGNVEIKNRIVLCPMGGTSIFGWMEPHHFDKDAADFFLTLAKNDVGLIIPGIAPLRNMIGNGWLYKKRNLIKKIKPFMDEIHSYGSKLFVQLTAGFGRSFSIPNGMTAMLKNKVLGALVKPIFDIDRLTASPSALPLRWAPNLTAREITKEEIKEMVDAFAKTARLCKDAGIDGVEIHAVHEGYLIDQFTTKYTNKRTDEYGGSFENRYRFPVEIVKAIKKECGEDFPVSLRYSAVSKTKGFCEGALPGEKYKEVGRDLKESEKAAKYLQDAGYDMLNADNGTYDAWYWAHPPVYMPNNCNLEEVAHIRKFVDIPVVCAGKMDPATSAKAIKEGKIDAMGVARQFLVDNEWVTKLKEERIKDIKPCIHCHNACLTMSHYEGVANACAMADSIHMSRCAINPQSMDGGKYDYLPTKSPKNIAIIGGGVGGMEAGIVLTKRGHKVTIYEKTNKLGGVFIAASAPEFKHGDKALIEWYRKQIKDLKIEVKFKTEVKDLTKLNADEIIVATGAKAKKLPILGFDKAIEAVDYLNGKADEKLGKTIAILGGGLTGCEIAYDLLLKGKKVIIIEAKQDLIVGDNISLANSSYLRDYIKYKKAPVYLNSTCKEIKDGSVVILKQDKTTEEVKVDSVISAVGYNPNPVATEVSGKKVYVIGDAYQVGNLRTVIWRAWDIATKL